MRQSLNSLQPNARKKEMNFRNPYTKSILSVGNGLMIQAGDIYVKGIDLPKKQLAGGPLLSRQRSLTKIP